MGNLVIGLLGDRGVVGWGFCQRMPFLSFNDRTEAANPRQAIASGETYGGDPLAADDRMSLAAGKRVSGSWPATAFWRHGAAAVAHWSVMCS